MGIFDAAAGASKLTPYGAAVDVIGSTVTTPNTSRSGDISSGLKAFLPTVGGINFGTQIPTWVWIVAAVGAGILLLRR